MLFEHFKRGNLVTERYLELGEEKQDIFGMPIGNSFVAKLGLRPGEGKKNAIRKWGIAQNFSPDCQISKNVFGG